MNVLLRLAISLSQPLGIAWWLCLARDCRQWFATWGKTRPMVNRGEGVARWNLRLTECTRCPSVAHCIAKWEQKKIQEKSLATNNPVLNHCVSARSRRVFTDMRVLFICLFLSYLLFIDWSVEEDKEHGELVSTSSDGEKALPLGAGGRPCRFAWRFWLLLVTLNPLVILFVTFKLRFWLFYGHVFLLLCWVTLRGFVWSSR